MKKKIVLISLILFVIVSFANAQTKNKSKKAIDTKPKNNFTSQFVRPFLYTKSLKDISDLLQDSMPIEWIFSKDELIELDILEAQTLGNTSTIVAQIKTGNAPNAINMSNNGNILEAILIEGRIRLTFESIANELTLLKIENLTVKFVRVPPNIRYMN